VVPAGDHPQPGSIAADITSNYQKISKANGITPYLDYATPTFFDTITAAAQDLIARKSTPQRFTKTLQTGYAGFKRSTR